MVGEFDLTGYYQLNFSLVKEHGFNLEEVEAMMPYERGVYVELLKKWLADEEKRLRELNR